MDSRWGRVARGWTAAGFATVVAAVSHTLAGGIAPSPFALVVSFALSATACTLLAGRGLSLWRLAASVALSQVLFHMLFSGLGMPVAAAHAHGATVLSPVATHHSGGMWLAHVAAGVVTVAALRYAETAFWGLGATARLFIERLVAIVIPVGLSVERHEIEPALDIRPHADSVLISALRYRGPPARVGAL